MEIYDDPYRVYPIRPAPPTYDRRYRKSSAGKELFLVSGALFLFLGAMVLLIVLSECLIAPMQTTLCLVASCLPLFLAGGLGIRYRHYPHMAKVCFAVSLLAGASCILWLFMEAYRLPGASGCLQRQPTLTHPRRGCKLRLNMPPCAAYLVWTVLPPNLAGCSGRARAIRAGKRSNHWAAPNQIGI